MRRGVSVRAYGGADVETGGDMVGEGTGVFSKKAGRKKRIEGEFRKKVHKFLFNLSLFSKIETFFSQKPRPFETKVLLLRLIKHNFPFIPPHCGVHIAQYRGTFPDHPAQTLFDLLNRRDFALSRSIRTGQKELFLNMGWHLHDSDIPLLVCTERRGARGRLLFHKKRGRSPSLDNAVLATPIRFLSSSHAANPRVYGALCAARWDPIGASRHRSWSDLKHNAPRISERRDSWGVVSYSNVEKGAIRNRRVRAHAPQRHRDRPRPYHPPWRSGGRHRHRP